MSLEDSATILNVGGVKYTFRKLEKWKAEGPTERNKTMVQFLASRHLSSEGRLMLINLALEWRHFSTWNTALQGGYSGGEFGPEVMIQAWGIFTFDQTKPMLVYSVLVSAILSYSPFPSFDVLCSFENIIQNRPNTRASIDLIRVLQAHAPVQDQQNANAWLKQQAVAVLSSIKQPPSVNDVGMFVSVAESEGLLFFSQMYVLAGVRNVSLT